MMTTLAQHMWAVRIHAYGGPERLNLEEAPRPVPRTGEVLVRVHAAGVNPLDWKIRQGLMKDSIPVTFPYIPGIEVAGVVDAVGPGVTDFPIGQAVIGLVESGGYAEFAAVPVGALARKPEKLSYVEAATVPVGATTAWRALFDHGGLEAGQRVLIQGAAGGVGVFAVQLAKWKGAQVVGVTSTANLDFVRGLGADTVVDYTATPVESVVQDVDLVLDGVGEPTLGSSLAVLKRGGTLVSIAWPPPEERARSRGVCAVMSRGTAAVSLRTLARLIEDGNLRVTAGKVFALGDVQAAHEYSQRGHGRGRIVLRIVD